jgi:UDP-N-acetyl-D-glucosamine dehydrogenase
LKGSMILALGVSYKRDAADLRESPALEVLKALDAKGALVTYSDPYIPSIQLNERSLKSVALTADMLKEFDCVVVLTDHSNVDYAMTAKNSHLVLDCRNALKDFSGSHIIPF